MGKADMFLKRQKKATISSSPTSSAARPFSDGAQPHVSEPRQQPVVPERPVPVFASHGEGWPAPSRRKWPGVVCGVIGGLFLLGIVGRSMDSSNGGRTTLLSNSGGAVSESAKAEIERYS